MGGPAKSAQGERLYFRRTKRLLTAASNAAHSDSRASSASSASAPGADVSRRVTSIGQKGNKARPLSSNGQSGSPPTIERSAISAGGSIGGALIWSETKRTAPSPPTKNARDPRFGRGAPGAAAAISARSICAMKCIGAPERPRGQAAAPNLGAPPSQLRALALSAPGTRGRRESRMVGDAASAKRILRLKAGVLAIKP